MSKLKPQQILSSIVALVLLGFFMRFREQLADAISTISNGALIPLLGALIFMCGRITLFSRAYTESYRMVGADVPLATTIPAFFRMIFVNTVLPSGGTSGLAMQVDAGRRNGVTVGKSTSAVVFTQSCNYISMFLIMFLGFVFMKIEGFLTWRDIGFGSIMGFTAFIYMALLVFAYKKPCLLRRFFGFLETWIYKQINIHHIKHRPKPWADKLVEPFVASSREIVINPRRSARTLLFMIGAVSCDFIAFSMACLAFGITDLGAMMGGYVSSMVFGIFSPTPGGMGIVEGIAAAVLVGYGYSASMSLSAILTYRALFYYLPFVAGAVFMRIGSDSSLLTSDGGKAGGLFATEMMERNSAKWCDAVSKISTIIIALLGLISLLLSGMPISGPTLTAFMENVSLTSTLSPVLIVIGAYLMLASAPGLFVRSNGAWVLASVSAVLSALFVLLGGFSIFWAMVDILVAVVLFMWGSAFNQRNLSKKRAWVLAVSLYWVALGLVVAFLGHIILGG